MLRTARPPGSCEMPNTCRTCTHHSDAAAAAMLQSISACVCVCTSVVCLCVCVCVWVYGCMPKQHARIHHSEHQIPASMTASNARIHQRRQPRNAASLVGNPRSYRSMVGYEEGGGMAGGRYQGQRVTAGLTMLSLSEGLTWASRRRSSKLLFPSRSCMFCA